VRTLLRRACLPILALAVASCWLTASLRDAPDSGASDGSVDAPSAEGGRDAGRDARVDARHDGSSPEGDVAVPTDVASDTPTSPDASCTGATYELAVLSARPLAYWRLDEDAGPIAVDRSGHNYKATYSDSGVMFAQPGVEGGRSVLLDGISGELTVNNPTFGPTSEFAPTTPYTLEAWIFPNAITSSFEGILSNELQTGTGREGYVMYLQQDAGIGFDRYGGMISTPLAEAGVVSTGHWYHVVGVYDSGEMTLYVNGTPVRSVKTSLEIDGGCTFAIGATHCGTLGWFPGYMEDVAVYDYALDSTCIQKHYALLTGK
jgi:hypothetical protein